MKQNHIICAEKDGNPVAISEIAERGEKSDCLTMDDHWTVVCPVQQSHQYARYHGATTNDCEICPFCVGFPSYRQVLCGGRSRISEKKDLYTTTEETFARIEAWKIKEFAEFQKEELKKQKEI